MFITYLNHAIRLQAATKRNAIMQAAGKFKSLIKDRGSGEATPEDGSPTSRPVFQMDSEVTDRQQSLFKDFFAKITGSQSFKPVSPASSVGGVTKETTMFDEDFRKLQEEYRDILPQDEDESMLVKVPAMKGAAFQPSILTHRQLESPQKR